MSGTTTGRAVSADGTSIGFDSCGSGPAIVLVHGAFTGKSHPTLAQAAEVPAAAVAAAVPGAIHRVLPGQTHNVCAEALAPELLEFFTAHP